MWLTSQDPALKAVQAKFPNVDIKAIQDDITIFGDSEDIFDEIGDGGEVIKLGALSLIIQELKARGLDCTRIKFACAGTKPDACARKQLWLKEPTTIEELMVLSFMPGASIFVTILFMFRHF